MKKVMILFATLFLLTGCDVEYNLEFNNDKFIEDVIITTDNNSEAANELLNAEQYAIFNDKEERKYNKNILRNDDKVSVSFSSDYTIDEYRKAILFNACYPVYGIQSDEKYYYISTAGSFECMVYDYIPVDNVTIKFKTNYLVTEHNADVVDGNNYIWYINNDNKDKKPINITLDRYEIVEVEEEKKEVDVNLILIVFGIAISIILLIMLIIKIVSVRKNKI